MDSINTKNIDETVFSNQEQIYDFYETLRDGPGESLEQFQSILEVFVCDILKHRKEIQRLEESYKREKETNERYLRNIEEDQERDMRQLEEKVREEERRKFEIERDALQQRAKKELQDLQSSLQRLQTIEQLHMTRKNDEDSSIVSLQETIAKLTEENHTLNTALNDALTSNAIFQSDLHSFKTQLNERQTMLLQEKQSASNNQRERESLQSNVRQLVEVNKQLRDENDSLRAIIDSHKLLSTSPEMLTSPKRLMSGTGSTLGSYWNNSKLSSPSPSYLNMNNQRRFDPFDLESADELGILGDGPRSAQKLDIQNAAKQLASTTFLPDRPNYERNIMNDSGLSLTTVRDATEFESDQESKENSVIAGNDSTTQRSLITKRAGDTDSDEVFVEVSLDRNDSKRHPRQRLWKKPTNNARALTKTLTNSSAQNQEITHSQSEQGIVDLPFDRMYKVVFCGDAAVGKSTLIMRLCKGKFIPSLNTTLGVDFRNKQIDVDGKHIAVQLWDTAGQERFRSIAKSYFRRCDGVVLVYDATYERSFLNVREWIETINEATPKKVSVMIVANKIDLRDQLRAEGRRVIEQVEGARLAKEYRALFIETSAKDGTNSSETLIELTRDMQCNEDLERFRTVGIDLDKGSKKSTCCGTRS